MNSVSTTPQSHLNRKLAPRFRAKEFICPCCDEEGIKQKVVDRLQQAHEKLPRGSVIIITSGYRCPAHNHNVGGKETSSHPKGWAVDIKCINSSYRLTLIKALMETGFNRIGIDFERGFVHVDMDPDKIPDLMWGYS